MEIAIVLGLLLIGVVLFARETLSVDLVTLLLLLGLIFTGILTTAEAFAGFSSDILIILASIFVISGALRETGVLDVIGGALAKISGPSIGRLYCAITIVPAGLSGFMNNTTVTAMFLPAVTGLANRVGLSPSQLLMPLAFASILGGTCSLIGTSTNVAVSGYIEAAGMEPLGFFEMTPIGLVIVVTGLLFMFFVGRRLLPVDTGGDLTDDYELRNFLSEVTVLADSPLIGQEADRNDLGLLDFRVLRLWRDGEGIEPDGLIQAADVLLIEGRAENLLKIRTMEKLEIGAGQSLDEIEGGDSRVVEAVITPRSELVGRTLLEIGFRERFGASALAVYRRGRSLREELSELRLQTGDVLLLQGTADRIEALRLGDGFSILEEIHEETQSPRAGSIALGLFVAAILVSAFGWVPLSAAFLTAAVGVVVLRCITVEKAYTVIDWRLLILIGGMTAFGTAMQNSGAAAFLADAIVGVLGRLGIAPVLAGFFILTILLTQPMSNAAAALVVLPVALEAARLIGGEERTFAIAIMLAGSISFITPFEPSCLLVYGPGKYRLMDFIRVGGWLTVLLTVVTLVMLPLLWPLEASQ